MTMASVSQVDRTRAGAILARLDRLPSTRHVWLLIAMLSLGGMFEMTRM
jgi:putative MFS transporter